VLVLAAATIVISLIVQGFTLEPLARRAGSVRPPPPTPGTKRPSPGCAWPRRAWPAWRNWPIAAPPPDEVIDRLRTSLQARIGTTRARMKPCPGAAGTAVTERALRGDLIIAESAELSRLYQDGTISSATRRLLNGTWTWKPPGSRKDSNKSTATNSAWPSNRHSRRQAQSSQRGP